jgi:ligand-binding sensor domain-containing protein/signal transduction histidine kinase
VKQSSDIWAGRVIFTNYLTALLMTFISTSAYAGTFSTDFNSGLPPKAQVFGKASVIDTEGLLNTGALELTSAHPAEKGSFVIDDLDDGKKVVSFNMRFRMNMGNAEGALMNDGVSINFTPDVPPDLGDDGATNGLSICFSPYLSSKGIVIPSIRIKHNGSNVVSSYFALRTETNYSEVQIQLDSKGALTVMFNGATAYDHSILFPYEPFAGRFSIGAQTGTSSDAHLIDDLWIKTETRRISAVQGSSFIKPRSKKISNASLLPEYSVRAWHVEEGLPQNMVQALVQTKDGYLWAGTRKGLARFDGLKFTVFNTRNTPGLRDSSVNALCEGKDGSLWIGTEGGLAHLRNRTFTTYLNGLPSEKVKAVEQASDGSILVGTTKGAVRFTDGKFENILPDLKGDAVRSIKEDSHGNIWMGMGVEIQKRGKDGKVSVYPTMNGLNINMVRSIFEDSKGVVWFGTTLGLHTFKDDKWSRYTLKNGLGHPVVSALCEDRSGSLWVGNYGGLSRMVDGKLGIELNGNGEPFDVVNAIVEDTEGDIWIAAKDGLYQLRSRRVEVYTRQQGLSYHNVTSVLEDKSGTVWMATWGGGLNRLKDGKFTAFNAKNSMASDLLLSLCEDRHGSLWIGTDYGAGIYHMTNGMFKYHGQEKGITNADVRVIYQDSSTNLWLGTASCLQLYNQDKMAIFTRKDGLAGENVRAILEDQTKNLWIGTIGGLSCLKEGKFKNFTVAQGLSDNGVLSLCEDDDKNLWIGTEAGNLNRLKDGKITTYRKENGLLNEEAFEILDDGLGSLWIASLNGISTVTKKSIADFDRGLTKTLACTLYGKDDGLVSIQCNGVSKPAAWKSKDGRLWFATTKGVAVIDPSSNLKRNDILPTVVVEALIVDKQSIPQAQLANLPLELTPGRRELEFHYSALSLQLSEKNRFKYQLQGVDADWVDAGTRRVAYYNNISPGTYTFKVIACNNDGLWNETGASLSLHLKPHFYETRWFYALCIIASGVGVVGVYRLNVRRLRRHQKALEALVEDRTKHLKAEISARQRMQTQLIEVSRQAGMAEVASGVLHNVGNVLNSVNVSATLAMDRLRTSKHASLEKAFNMIEEHSSDLGTFLSSDPKGKQLPGYISKLSTHLTEENVATIKELTLLCKNVDHIKDIVSMQQKYAKTSGVIERLKISEIIEDAININASRLAHHRLQVRKDYVHDPVVTVDKHKVLQILVNLFQNAKEACDAGGKSDRLLTVRTLLKGSTVCIVVADNGIGISTENLTKIFSHGFTTRPDGHGFGLHNSALAAKELGGSLVAHSDGKNCGATFTLELPVEPLQEKV